MEQNKEKTVKKPKDRCKSFPGCKKCKFPFINVGCKKCRSKFQPGKPGKCKIWPFLLPATLLILLICGLVYSSFKEGNLGKSKSNRSLSFGNKRNRFTIRKK